MSKRLKFIFLVSCLLMPKAILASDYHFNPPDQLKHKTSHIYNVALNTKILNLINNVPRFNKAPFMPDHEPELIEQMNYLGKYYNYKKRQKQRWTKSCPKSFKAFHRSKYPAIVRIFIKQTDGEMEFKGSGFFIKPNVLFTGLHVIDEPFPGLMEEHIFIQIPTVSQTDTASHSDIVLDIKSEKTIGDLFFSDSLAKSQHSCFSLSPQNKETYPKIQNSVLAPVKEVIAFSPKYDTALLRIEESFKHPYSLEKKYSGASKKTTLIGFPLGDFSILNARLTDEDNPMPYYKMIQIPYNDKQLIKNQHSSSADSSCPDDNSLSKYTDQTKNNGQLSYSFPDKYNTDTKKITVSTPNCQSEEILNGASGAPLFFEDGESIAGALLGKESKRGIYRFVPTKKILELLSRKSLSSCNSYQCIKEKTDNFLNRDYIEDKFEQYRVAQLHEIKNAFLPDAFYWYLKSAEQDYSPAQMALCRLHRYSCNIPQNAKYNEQGIHYCQKAAENGFVEAQYTLSILYYLSEMCH